MPIPLSASGSHPGQDDPLWYHAEVTVHGGGQAIQGVPIELTVSRDTESVTLFGVSGVSVLLPLRRDDLPGQAKVLARELISGVSGEGSFTIGGASALAQPAVDVRQPHKVDQFAARKDRPLIVALTPDQAGRAELQALARRLADHYGKLGRTVEVRTIAPLDLVSGLQEMRASRFLPEEMYPQWSTVAADLILLGNSRNNLLLYDQTRGRLLPDHADLPPGQALVSLTYSPFVAHYNVLNLLATDDAGLNAAVERVIRPIAP